MPFVLVIVGILLIVTGAQGTYKQFGSQVASDFTGKGNFEYWIAAIGTVGAIGYIQALQTISRLLMALIIIVMFLSNRGFFVKLQQAIAQGPKAPAPGLSFGASGTSGPSLTPQQGVAQGAGGAGVNWNPFTNGNFDSFKKYFGF